MQTLPIWQIAILAIIQGLAELLPVSSSAHVILAQHWMGLDPGAPQMTFLLVMLHTGTMFAVLLYFWKRWKAKATTQFLKMIVIATACTGVLGLGLKVLIEKVILERMMGQSKGEVEQLFRNLPMMASSLLLVGIVILVAGLRENRSERQTLEPGDSVWIGLIQGLCLPFRGFSRSGATISTGIFRNISRELAEEFSFALAVVLTPPVIVQEFLRLWKSLKVSAPGGAAGFENTAAPDVMHLVVTMLTPGLMGMVFSFGAGLLALRWLSSWLEKGRWRYFGIYCMAFSAVVLIYCWIRA